MDPTQPTDHYAVLGVSENATREEIRTAYRKRMLESHPDRNPNNVAEAHRKAVKINLANEILTNESDRQKFDDFRRRSRQSETKPPDAAQQRAYREARQRYQESEDQARERVKKWFYDRRGVRPEKKHSCYTLRGDQTTLDNLLTKINERMRDKAWEYRITTILDTANRMKYRIRVVCDPTKCAFHECHSDWVEDYYYGLFKPGTPEDAAHNERIVRTWLGDILNKQTWSYRIHVFFGVVGDSKAPWRCYLDLSVVLVISEFDAFFHTNVPGLTKFAKENSAKVVAVFKDLAIKNGISPADLYRNKIMRRNLARHAENVVRAAHGMKILREWGSPTS